MYESSFRTSSSYVKSEASAKGPELLAITKKQSSTANEKRKGETHDAKVIRRKQ